VRAVALVGGFGTRLRPLTRERPKQMLPVVDRPMLEWVVGHLGAHGVTEVVLSLGYRPDAFRAAYPDGRCAGVDLHYAVEPEPLDTAGAIRFAARHADVDGPFIVVNGDVMTDLDLDAFLAHHRDREAEATIHLIPVEDPSRYGVVPTDEDSRVEAFVEKPTAAEAPSRWINAGTYVLEPSVIGRIPADRPVSVERETFPAMVDDGSLFAFESEVYWVDAGTPASYLDANLDLIRGRREEQPAAVAVDADIAADAVLEDAVVMEGARVGPGASVTESVVLPGAVVGPGARIDRSLIGWSAQVGERAQVRDLTVLGQDARVGADEDLRGIRRPEPADA
jgi:mannose-1-phosphate guanylyltransferase